MDALDQRLQILHQAGMLSDRHAEDAALLREFFSKRYGITLTEENADAFFTHFCMALHRLETDERIDPVDEVIQDEIQDEADYDNACFVADEIQQSVVALPDWERGYILMHLIVLLGKVREAYDREILGE